jgi:hypothetical protein
VYQVGQQVASVDRAILRPPDWPRQTPFWEAQVVGDGTSAWDPDSQLATNRVAVEKLFPAKFAEVKLRQDDLQNGFLDFGEHFLSPKFWLFWGKLTFSTATRDYTHNWGGWSGAWT